MKGLTMNKHMENSVRSKYGIGTLSPFLFIGGIIVFWLSSILK